MSKFKHFREEEYLKVFVTAVDLYNKRGRDFFITRVLTTAIDTVIALRRMAAALPDTLVDLVEKSCNVVLSGSEMFFYDACKVDAMPENNPSEFKNKLDKRCAAAKDFVKNSFHCFDPLELILQFTPGVDQKFVSVMLDRLKTNVKLIEEYADENNPLDYIQKTETIGFAVIEQYAHIENNIIKRNETTQTVELSDGSGVGIKTVDEIDQLSEAVESKCPE